MASDGTAKLGGASTTDSLITSLRAHLSDASPPDRRRIRSLLIHFEGDVGHAGIGRPEIDDADAIGRIAERMSSGVSRCDAVLAEARWLLARGFECASLDSVRHRLRKKLDTTRP
jgi:hypothetical protein